MPRLPDYRQVGEPGSYRSGRGVVSAGELDASAVGRGVARVGQSITKISEEEHQKQSAMGLLEADIHKARYGTELERSFDDDPDYPSYDMRWKTGVSPINEDAASKIPDPELRKKWLLQQEAKDIGTNERLTVKATGMRKAADLAKVNTLLDEGSNAYIAEKDDTLRMQRLAENEARITFAEQQGLLTPEQAATARNNYILKAKERRLQMMLDEDPDSVIPKVAGTRISKPYGFGDPSVVKDIPALKGMGIAFAHTPRADGPIMEFWPAGEPGSKDRPRPVSLPIDKPGVETFRDNVSPLDVLGDITSHHLIETDPKIKKVYKQFQASLTPSQERTLKEQYQWAKKNQGEERSFEDWKARTGLPAYFRGYAFKQWPSEVTDKAYTAEQREMLDGMMGYLTNGTQIAPYATRATGGASDSGLQFLREVEDFKERAYPDGRQYSVGFGTKAKSANEVITREEAERRLLAETNKVAKWVDSNISVPLTVHQKDSLISFGYNLGTDDLEKLKADINAGNFEKVAQRMLSFDRANLDGEGLKRLPGLSRRRQMEAQMFLGEVPDAEFADLPPDVRSKFAKEARTAKNTRLESRLWDFKQQIDDDVESIRQTGVGRENIELDAIKKTVEPSVWNGYINNRREAEMEYEAGRDLTTMPTGEIGTHLENLVPTPGETDYGMKASVYEKTKSKADKLRKLREDDPAASVNDLPEVKRASEQFAAQQAEGGADFGKVVRARLEAQERVGIPSYDQSPITKSEGQALLDLPSNTSGLNEREYLNRLKSAADRAEQQYGPLMARPVFEAAVRFHIKDKTGSDAAAGIISKMTRGEAVTRDEYQRMTELQSIDQISRTFDATLRPDMGDEDRPYISPMFARDNLSFVTQYAAQEAGKRPAPAQEQWLRDNAGEAGAVAEFDLRFGRGAAARVLASTNPDKDAKDRLRKAKPKASEVPAIDMYDLQIQHDRDNRSNPGPDFPPLRNR